MLLWIRKLRAGLCAICVVALATTGCIQRGNYDDFEFPEMTTGVNATVILPGDGRVPMPPPPVYPSAQAGQPAPTNAPGGTAPAQGYPPQPHTGATQGSGGYGQTHGQPSGGGVLLGGSAQQSQRREEKRDPPQFRRWITLPFAIIAYPFKKIYDWVSSDDEESQAVATAQPPAPVYEPPHAAHERAQLEHIERQLGQPPQAAPAPSHPISQPAHTPPSARPSSIAAELAALQRAAQPTTPPPVPPLPPSQGAAELGAGRGADQMRDRDGNGRPDQWSYRERGSLTRESYDDDGDGRAERQLRYEPSSGQLASSQEDVNRDGRPDTWTEYQHGNLHRRRADRDGDGELDTWTYYRDGQIARHEEDTDGDGFRDRVAFYEAGKIVREEQDQDGNGRPDRVTHFDDNEQPSHREEDTNGDGEVDVRSYYNDGRLTRRELLE